MLTPKRNHSRSHRRAWTLRLFGLACLSGLALLATGAFAA